MFYFLTTNSAFALNSPQAGSTKRGTGQPTQIEDLGPLQARLWCHCVLLRTILKAMYKNEKVYMDCYSVIFNDGWREDFGRFNTNSID